MASEVIFEVKVYSPIACLNRLAEQKLEIKDFHEISEFTYSFACATKDEKKVVKAFKEARIVKRSGIQGTIFSLWRKKTTLLSIIVALVLFTIASTRLYEVRIKGGSPEISTRIRTYLDEKELRRFEALPSRAELKAREDELLRLLSAEIESLELKRHGLILEVSYQKRRSPIVLPAVKHTLVAKRDGVITRFVIARGERLVAVSDFVQKGQILVSETIVGFDKKEVLTFTSGEVFANTWYEAVATVAHTDEASDYSQLLQKCDVAVLGPDKKLIDRQILSYRVSGLEAKMKLHYTLEENIAVSEN